MYFIKRNIVLGLVLIIMGFSIQLKGEQSILITGGFEQIAVHGNSDIEELTITDLLTGQAISTGYSLTEEGEVTKLSFTGSLRVKIDIPKTMDIKIEPEAIVSEGQYIYGRDLHYIHVFDSDGEIEINADGYYVHLVRTTGSISVVTYEDISAHLPQLFKESIVSLDTYRGDILLYIPRELQPQIKASANKGKISIGKKNTPYNMDSATGNKVILNTEQGAQVDVRTITQTSQPPTHPELRDRLVKIYIEDQGKKRMDPRSRWELTAMGYGPFIEAMDDVYKGHFFGNKNRKEVADIIGEFGIPSAEMVGEDYARKAVRMVIWQGDAAYVAKYRSQFIEAFGEEWMLIKDKMEKRKKNR